MSLRSLAPEERLLEQRVVLLRGEITRVSANRVIMQMLYLNSVDAAKPIRLEVDSAGGAVDDVLTVYDIVRHLEEKREQPVWTHAVGRAEGGAALMVAAGTKGHRSVAGGAVFRLTSCHAAEAGVAAGELQRTDDVLAGLLSDRTGQDKADCLAAMRAGRTFTAGDAVAWGLVDGAR